MTPLAAANLALFGGLVAASATLVLRTLLVDFGLARLALEVRPFNCDLCCSFWGATAVSVVFVPEHGLWAAAALGGIAPSMALLRAVRPPVTPVALPLPPVGLEQVK